ncbi:membrane protein insertion efficiency factor YidD [Candidatus Uhrbacteria bacterium]|nr:membrane protein insertion efficiency factor YidD [Candidatus Uhrbacteria bacterium]
MIKYLAIGTIWLYQRTFSLDHGPLRIFFPYGFCRYQPTCSDYAKEALRRRGFFVGMWLALARILRCHPWARGGSDPVR